MVDANKHLIHEPALESALNLDAATRRIMSAVECRGEYVRAFAKRVLEQDGFARALAAAGDPVVKMLTTFESEDDGCCRGDAFEMLMRKN